MFESYFQVFRLFVFLLHSWYNASMEFKLAKQKSPLHLIDAHRPDLHYWMTIGVVPAYLTDIFVKIGQKEMTPEQAAARENSRSADEIQAAMVFRREAVEHLLAASGAKVTLRELTAEEFDDLYCFVLYGEDYFKLKTAVSQEVTKQGGSASALKNFRRRK